MGIVMDDSAKSIKPIGNMVLLRLVKVEKKPIESKSGLLISSENVATAGQTIGGSFGTVYRAYIDSVGKDVDLSKYDFKIGDWVVFNNMDVMGIDLPDPEDPLNIRKFGLTKPESIWAVYEE